MHDLIKPVQCSTECEHRQQWKIFIQSFHLSGDTFRFGWTVQDLGSFLGFVQFVFGSEMANYFILFIYLEAFINAQYKLPQQQIKSHTQKQVQQAR